MLPEDVPHEGRGAGEEGLPPHAHQVAPFHLELVHGDALEAEVFDGPDQPLSDVVFGPLLWVCGRGGKGGVSEAGGTRQKTKEYIR